MASNRYNAEQVLEIVVRDGSHLEEKESKVGRFDDEEGILKLSFGWFHFGQKQFLSRNGSTTFIAM